MRCFVNVSASVLEGECAKHVRGSACAMAWLRAELTLALCSICAAKSIRVAGHASMPCGCTRPARHSSRRDVLLAAAAAGCGAWAVPEAADAMIGGRQVAQEEMMALGLVGLTVGNPVALGARRGMCSGTLIADGLALTARHCLHNPLGELRHVVFSADIFAADADRRPISRVVTTDDFECDLAIVEFEGDAPSGYQYTRLITGMRNPYPSTDGSSPVQVYGFGRQTDGADERMKPNGLLKTLGGRVLGQVDGLSPVLTVSPLSLAEGPCFGDSGGPAFLRLDPQDTPAVRLVSSGGSQVSTGLAQVGVLSFGAIDECAGGIEEYVNLAEYGPWIEDSVASLGRELGRELPRA